MVLFTKYIMDADKPIPVVNILPMRFIGDPKKREEQSTYREPRT